MFGSLTTVAVKGADPAAWIFADPGFTVTVVPGTVTLVEPVEVVAATDVARISTTKSPAGNVVGAVYVVGAPLRVFVGEIEPQGPGVQPTDQVTPLFVGSLVTVAVNCAVVLMLTVGFCGLTDTATAATVMVALLDTLGSATDVPVTLTCKGLPSAMLGAV